MTSTTILIAEDHALLADALQLLLGAQPDMVCVGLAKDGERAMALATTVRPGLFSEPERENGRAAWLLGASFISEGAIPFAAADPFRVIPSMMAGGAVTGALIMAFDVTLKAPHGGIFVFFAIGKLAWFLVALAAGTVVGALAVITAKQLTGARPSTESPVPA